MCCRQNTYELVLSYHERHQQCLVAFLSATSCCQPSAYFNSKRICIKCNTVLCMANMGFLIVQAHETPSVVGSLIKGLDH